MQVEAEIHDIKKEIVGMAKLLVKLEEILNITLVHHREKLATHDKELSLLKKHDEEFQEMIHTSCTIKTKEIDDSAKEVEDKLYPEIRATRSTLIKMMLGLSSLFIGAVVYFNTQVGILHEKINNSNSGVDSRLSQYNRDIGQNTAKLDYIITMLKDKK